MKTSFVADGDRDFLTFAERQLVLFGYQVSGFKSSADLLKGLRQKPSLIILGELTDGVHASEVIRAIRLALPNAILFHVAKTGAQIDAVSSVRAGATEFIEKNSATFVRLRTTLDLLEKQKKSAPSSFLKDIKKVFIG